MIRPASDTAHMAVPGALAGMHEKQDGHGKKAKSLEEISYSFFRINHRNGWPIFHRCGNISFNI